MGAARSLVSRGRRRGDGRRGDGAGGAGTGGGGGGPGNHVAVRLLSFQLQRSYGHVVCCAGG
jgi:hypothetical protein